MAWTATNKLSGNNSGNGTSYVTASLSVTAGKMYLLAVRHGATGAGGANVPTVSGAGQTWAQVDTREYIATNSTRLTLFRCEAASTTSGALTISFGGQTQFAGNWTVTEIDGQVQGSNGSTAIVQSAKNGSVAAGTSLTVTLSAFAEAENATFLCSQYGFGGSNNATVEGGYTELVEQGAAGVYSCHDQFLASSDTTPSFTIASSAAIHNAIAVEIRSAVINRADTDTGAGTDIIGTHNPQHDDTGAGADTHSDFSTEYPDSGTGTDDLSALAVQYDDTGTGVDDGGLELTAMDSDSGTGTDAVLSIETSLSPGKLHIGKFITATPLYTIENEIISHDMVDDSRRRSNVAAVDGEDDSWTEYDRVDLTSRDFPVNSYMDLPELKTAQGVRQRAVEELQTARGVISPGGEVVGPMVLDTTRMDPIFWIDEHGNKWQTRIEGKHVVFDMTMEPRQTATIDTGAIIFCPPDEADVTYIARDLFEREDTELGDALLGGTWVIYR